MRKCNVCGKKFKLIKENRYEVVEIPVGINCLTQATTYYNAFDCPHCGCQNIVGVIKKKESRKRGANMKMVIDVPKSVDLDLVLKASQFAVYRYIEEGSKMFATGIGTDCRTIDWVDVINALAELREEIENDKETSN